MSEIKFAPTVDSAWDAQTLEEFIQFSLRMCDYAHEDERALHAAFLRQFVPALRSRDFVVRLDDLASWLGIKQKASLKRTLKSSYVEGRDYQVVTHSGRSSGQGVAEEKAGNDLERTQQRTSAHVFFTHGGTVCAVHDGRNPRSSAPRGSCY